jgi:hypothetical protein
MSSRYLVASTSTKQRRQAKDDYIVCINASRKKDSNLGRCAAVTHTVSHEGNEIKLKVHCRVVIDDSLPENTAAIDQTIRNALGIPFEFNQESTFVEVYPLRLSVFQSAGDFLSRILGRRYLFLRVCKADISDMEKNLVRIPLDAFKLLGTDAGNKLMLEFPQKVEGKDEYLLKNLAIKAYELIPEIVERRRKLEEPHISSRYPDVEQVLGISPDISRAFLDTHTRELLGDAQVLDAIKARRDPVDLFWREFREFGLIFFVSLFAIVSVFQAQGGWLILISLGALLIALILVFVRIRSLVM